jgi:hypothetical protein
VLIPLGVLGGVTVTLPLISGWICLSSVRGISEIVK